MLVFLKTSETGLISNEAYPQGVHNDGLRNDRRKGKKRKKENHMRRERIWGPRTVNKAIKVMTKKKAIKVQPIGSHHFMVVWGWLLG